MQEFAIDKSNGAAAPSDINAAQSKASSPTLHTMLEANYKLSSELKSISEELAGRLRDSVNNHEKESSTRTSDGPLKDAAYATAINIQAAYRNLQTIAQYIYGG